MIIYTIYTRDTREIYNMIIYTIYTMDTREIYILERYTYKYVQIFIYQGDTHTKSTYISLVYIKQFFQRKKGEVPKRLLNWYNKAIYYDRDRDIKPKYYRDRAQTKINPREDLNVT